MSQDGGARVGAGGRPIFVGGLERTGTSLMYALLASHPAISMTRRTNWWRYFDGHFGDLGKDENLDACLDAMRRYRRHIKLEPDFDRLRSDLKRGPRTYERLFELLEVQRAEQRGRPRWGDKSLETERYADRVFDAFPDARILHMVRDPRDRYASVIKRWHRSRGGIGAATAMWIASADLAARNARRYPEGYLVVRYEDLARHPEEMLRRICAFIGEPFAPEMLGMGGDREFRDGGGNSSYGAHVPGVISTSSIGRYPDVLSAEQIAYVQDQAGRRMLDLGYALDPQAARPARTTRYRVWLRPMQLGRAGAWHVRELVRDLVGRSPSAHTMAARLRDADA